MAKFIKITFHGKPCIYNVNLIAWVYTNKESGKTMIATMDEEVDEADESFEEIERLLYANGGIDYSSLNKW